MRKILIVGATSAIAEACARIWAERGDKLFLAARNESQVLAIEADLKTKGASQVACKFFDANDLDSHIGLLDDAAQTLGGLNTVLIAHGTLTDQARAQSDSDYAMTEIQTNGMSVVHMMGLVAEKFEVTGKGDIAVISSVAGDRGRQSNYVYGSAKALVSAFASGLRQRLAKRQINVLTVKPGFVSTPMTAHLKQGILWAKPDAVAKDIVRGLDQRRSVIYTPGFWRMIMIIIRHIPEFLFKRVKL